MTKAMMTDISKDLLYARKLVVSLIKSPLYADTQLRQDRELRQFFSTRRKLKKGDSFRLASLYESGLEYQFKVIDTEPKLESDFYADSVHTSLVQTELDIKDKWAWPWQKKFEIVSEYTDEMERIINFYKSHHEYSETLPMMLLHGPSGSGKLRSIEALAAKLSVHLCKINGINLVGDSASAVEKRIEIFFNQSMNYGPCLIFIKSFLFKLKDINEFNKRIVNSFFQCVSRLKEASLNRTDKMNSLGDSTGLRTQPPFFFVICSAPSKQSIDSSIVSNFNFELPLKCLNERQRISVLKNATATDLKDTDLKEFLKKSSGLYYGELETLVDFIRADMLTKELSLVEAMQTAYKRFAQNRKFEQENKLNIEAVNWSDVGGLGDIKQIIIDTIMLPLNYPKLFASSGNQLGMTRSGILLYGPPGTGKTLLAKAISNECEINFLSVKGPELLDMYVGQTEQNVRNLFEKARQNAPCVLFFDELDSLAPIRGRAGDSGGVMDRVVSQLLTEIDGLDKFSSASSGSNKSSQIFLIGATNRPDLIDASLLRPGRFDKLIYVPIPKSFDERLNIFKSLLRKLPVNSDFDMEKFIANCPSHLSGADFYALTNKARQSALKRLIGEFEQMKRDQETKLCADEEALKVSLTGSDFEQALICFQPTLSEQAFLDYEKYFQKYSSGDKSDK